MPFALLKSLTLAGTSCNAAGATASVAGVKGRVYRMTWTDSDGSRLDPPATTFELPAEPMDLQSLMGDMMNE